MTDLIHVESHKLEQDALVEMYEIELKDETILRFSPSSVAGAHIFFAGKEYQSIPIQAEGFQWTGSGTIPRPTLTLASADTSFLSLVIGDDLTGCPVTRMKTYRKYLDDGDHPNPTALFPLERYVINKKTEHTKHLLVYELTTKQDQEGRMVPALQVIRDTCRHRFRKWDGHKWNYAGVTCPYTNSRMYDEHGNQTSDPYKAQCGRKVTDCQLHFGEGATLPIRAFPGVGRI